MLRGEGAGGTLNAVDRRGKPPEGAEKGQPCGQEDGRGHRESVHSVSEKALSLRTKRSQLMGHFFTTEPFPAGADSREPACRATHSSVRAWRVPRTEGPGGLQSSGSPRVGHD